MKASWGSLVFECWSMAAALWAGGQWLGLQGTIVVGLDLDNDSLSLAAICGRWCGGQEAAVESPTIIRIRRAAITTTST